MKIKALLVALGVAGSLLASAGAIYADPGPAPDSLDFYLKIEGIPDGQQRQPTILATNAAVVAGDLLLNVPVPAGQNTPILLPCSPDIKTCVFP